MRRSTTAIDTSQRVHAQLSTLARLPATECRRLHWNVAETGLAKNKLGTGVGLC